MTILLNNIKKFLKNNRVIFAVFIISQIVTSISIIYIYAIFDAKKTRDIIYNNDIRSYTVLYSTKISDDIPEKLNTVYQKYEDFLEQIVLFSNSEYIKLNYLYPGIADQSTQIGSYFSKEAFENGERQIIINDESSDQYNIGDIYILHDREYTVVGLTKNDGYNEIPFKALNSNITIEKIVFIAKDIPNKTQNEEITAYLHTVFDDVRVSPPPEANYFLSSENISSYFMSIAIFLLAIVNISYIYRYILYCRKRQFVIIRVSGCSMKRALFLYLSEIIILSTVQFTLSCLISHFCISRFFAYLNFYLTYSMDIYKYIGLYTLYMLIVILVFMNVILKFIRKPIYRLI
jgi:hypothetical protein